MRVKTEERRQAIVDIAKEAFTKKGLEQTSMSYIAQKLGGSKATLYNYFSSKEDIFAAVMESSVTSDVASAFDKLSNSVALETALFDFGFHYLQSIMSYELDAIRKMALCESGRSEISRYFYINGPGKGRESIAQYLNNQMENGSLTKTRPQIAAAQLIALLEAELVPPFEMNVIEKPNDTEIKRVAETAIDSFLKIYQGKETS